jgi:hypothetical protein
MMPAHFGWSNATIVVEPKSGGRQVMNGVDQLYFENIG